jgi:hypothetical protein
MLKDNTHTEQYITWRKSQIKVAKQWWENGIDREVWYMGLNKPVSVNDPQVHRRFDLARIVDCQYEINKIRLAAFKRPTTFLSDGPSGQGRS